MGCLNIFHAAAPSQTSVSLMSWAGGLHPALGLSGSREQRAVGAENTVAWDSGFQGGRTSPASPSERMTWLSEEELIGDFWAFSLKLSSGCSGRRSRGSGLHLREVRTPLVSCGLDVNGISPLLRWPLFRSSSSSVSV